MYASEAKRLRALEDENRRLKKLVADQALDIAMLKAWRDESGDDRAAAARRHPFTSRLRRECAVRDAPDRFVALAAALPTTAPGARRPIRARLKELATQRPRFGYKRLHVLLRRDTVSD